MNHTKQPHLSFYSRSRGVVVDDIWDELEEGLWQQYNIDHRLHNDTLGEMRITEWLPVLNDFEPILPGFRYDQESDRIVEERYTPEVVPMDGDRFLEVCHHYFEQYRGRKIGVHLSGGLDSGLVIGLLHHLEIPFSLYGLTTDRYEFRTEHRIQEILSEWGEEVRYIDLEEYPFYSEPDSFPAHQIPEGFIKMQAAATALAEAASVDGVDVLFGGQGADTLFVDAVPEPPKKLSFNIGNEFLVPWEQEVIYAPKGVDMVSFYADPTIIEAIYNLRIGQREDPWKVWARSFFRSYLPRELSDYHYCADFNGLSMSGLELAKPTVVQLFEEAYDRLKHPIFSPAATRKMMETNVFTFDYKMYCDYCTRISIAVWIHALFREN